MKEEKLKKKSLNELPEELPGWVKNDKDGRKLPDEEGEYLIMWGKYMDIAVYVSNDVYVSNASY